MKQRVVVCFDFDGTLTRGDSLLPFLFYVTSLPLFLLKSIRLAPLLFAYVLGLVRNDVAKERVLSCFLAGRSSEQLRQQGKCFARDRLPRMQRASMMECLAWHLRQGHECVLVSASVDLYLEPWAREAGFSELVCSRLREVNGVIVPGFDGGNCHGPEKRRRLEAMWATNPPDRTYAYGDSCGDRAMLTLVDEGWWVEGDRIKPFN